MSKPSRSNEERERLVGGLACECGQTVNLVSGEREGETGVYRNLT
jgi:hypothetical protein